MWVDVLGYSKYEINEEGVVRNKKTKRALTPTLVRKKFPAYRIMSDTGVCGETGIASLVMRSFHPEEWVPHRKTVCKDGNIKNYRLDNLDWANKARDVIKTKVYRRIKVYKLDPDTEEVIDVYSGIREAAEKNYTNENSLYRATAEAGRNCAGFKWRKETYYEEVQVNTSTRPIR